MFYKTAPGSVLFSRAHINSTRTSVHPSMTSTLFSDTLLSWCCFAPLSKLLNLNPTETTTCRRCQSDTGTLLCSSIVWLVESSLSLSLCSSSPWAFIQFFLLICVQSQEKSCSDADAFYVLPLLWGCRCARGVIGCWLSIHTCFTDSCHLRLARDVFSPGRLLWSQSMYSQGFSFFSDCTAHWTGMMF